MRATGNVFLYVLSTLVLAITVTCTADAQVVIFVDADSSDGGDGLSWGTAYNDVQDALDHAIGDPNVEEIWVAEGVYLPDRETEDRASTFQLINNVGVYGGFAGDESTRDERDWLVHETILSGDLLQDDDSVGITDNCRSVVTVTGTDITTVISGFIITAAYAGDGELGAGIFARDGSPLIVDCTIIRNVSRAGAGIYIDNAGDPIIINCRILGNTATIIGGGAFVGGEAHGTFYNCLLSGNFSEDRGGAFSCEHGMLNISNCTISNNEALSSGGGMYLTSDTQLVMQNSILWGNTDSRGQGQRSQIRFVSSSDSVDINYCCIEGLTGSLGGIGNLASDPRFVDADGVDDISGTPDDDCRLSDNSPVIDAGNDTSVPPDLADLDNDQDTTEQIPFDLDYNVRFIDDTGVLDSGKGSAPIADIGSLERIQNSSRRGFYIGEDNGSWFDSANWEGAKIPNSNTDVTIQRIVRIDQAGGLARSVRIGDGGSLVISNGTLVTSTIVVLAGGSIILDHSSSVLTIDRFDIRVGALFSWRSGTIELGDGTSFSSIPLTIGTQGEALLSTNTGTRIQAPEINILENAILRGGGEFICKLTNAGVVSPGFSAGSILVDGDYEQTSTGQLWIELEGYSPGDQYDTLDVSGNSTIDGLLYVEALEGMVPELGGVHNFFTSSNTINGVFATIILSDLPGDFSLFFRQNLHSLSLLTVNQTVGGKLYVFADADKGGDGFSWETALNDLQDALDIAKNGNNPIAEIWVAAGIYKPTFEYSQGSPRSKTFFFIPNLHVLGGFAGNETESNQRNPQVNITTLSGDIGVGGDMSDNSWSVLYSNHADESSVYDGFIIKEGRAEGIENRGAGMKNVDGNPTIINCRFENNVAEFQGGAIHSMEGMFIFKCEFVNNSVLVREGGAIYGIGNDYTIRECLFENNHSPWGGGAMWIGSANIVDSTFIENDEIAIMAFGHLRMKRCWFENNHSAWTAGAIDGDLLSLEMEDTMFLSNSNADNGGAVQLRELDETAIITNCVFLDNSCLGNGGGIKISGTAEIFMTGCIFSGNSAASGGGAWVGGHILQISNCTFSLNSATNLAGGLYLASANSQDQVANSIFWENDVNGKTNENAQIVREAEYPRINYSCIQGLTGNLGGIGNIDNNPLFADPNNNNFRIGNGSPCIDAADNDAVPLDLLDIDNDGNTVEAIPIDIEGNLRFVDDPDTIDTGNGTPPIVDIGAYEFQVDDVITAKLVGFSMVTGTLLDGALPDLLDSDDSYIHTRSGFGETFIDLHSMEMIVNAVTTVDSPGTLELTIESRIDEPSGLAQIKLRNWNTNQFEFVGSYPLGNTDQVNTIDDIDATNYVNTSGGGEIDLSIKHLVFVPFLAFTFESFIDVVELGVN